MLLLHFLRDALRDLELLGVHPVVRDRARGAREVLVLDLEPALDELRHPEASAPLLALLRRRAYLPLRPSHTR